MSSETKKTVSIGPSIAVKDFAAKLSLPVSRVISELMKNGILASINEKIDYETAAIIAEYLGFEAEKEKEPVVQKEGLRKEAGKLKSRPPVVAMLGHVDHGKTKLLDTIRRTNLVSKEAGGITQSIGAYQAKAKGKLITFLDTPGHEAFRAMRRRGTHLADIVVLVIAADDGIKPQTVEAIGYCQKSKIPIVVAINKIDKPEANPEKVKSQLAEYGIVLEERGGKTVSVEISAKTGQGIDNLLEMILLVADMADLRADPTCPAEGFVIESFLDSRKGPVATILIKNGTLKKGDFIRTETVIGRIRRLEDFQGNEIKEGYPSQPVIIIGLNKIPRAGDAFEVEKNIKTAKIKAAQLMKKEQVIRREEDILSISKKIEQKTIKAMIKKLNIILKTDGKGSLEAISEVLNAIKSEEVACEILKSGVGAVSESDIKLAKMSKALVFGFNVKVIQRAAKLAKKEGVEIKLYDVIYELIKDIKEKLSELLEPEVIRTDLGKLKVIAIFKTGKAATEARQDMVIGATVISGKVKKGALLDVIRGKEKIGRGKVEELQMEKKIIAEVKEGQNAGIHFKGDVRVKLGDVLEVYEEIKKKRTL